MSWWPSAKGPIVRALCPGRPATGEKVMLTTRPSVSASPTAPCASTPAQNRLSVTVTEAVFAGERCRYMLQARDGTAMVLKEPSSAAIRRRAVGERTEIALVGRGYDPCPRGSNIRFGGLAPPRGRAPHAAALVAVPSAPVMPLLLAAPLLLFMLVF